MGVGRKGSRVKIREASRGGDWSSQKQGKQVNQPFEQMQGRDVLTCPGRLAHVRLARPQLRHPRLPPLRRPRRTKSTSVCLLLSRLLVPLASLCPCPFWLLGRPSAKTAGRGGRCGRHGELLEGGMCLKFGLVVLGDLESRVQG